MTLAGFIKQDEEALICDLAEVYNIYDYRQMPPSYIAVLAKGLDNDSRIKQSFTGLKVTEDYLLQSLIFDRLNLLLWMFGSSKDNSEPVSLYEQLINKSKTSERKSGFESGEEFEERRLELLRQLKKGG